MIPSNKLIKLHFCLVLCLSLSIFQLQAQQLEVKRPKNIIIMIGDGMGFNHVLAAEYFFYGEAGKSILNSEGFIAMAQATYPAITRTKEPVAYAQGYNADSVYKNPALLKKGYTDSGAAATALATGKKTFKGAIGIGLEKDTLFNLTELAKNKGKAAGVVTSVPISHATPAGFVTHNVSRNNYAEIAQQMILQSQLDVIMGCGNPDYSDNGELKNEDAKYVGGEELWLQLQNKTPQQKFLIENTHYVLKDIDGDHIPDAWTLIQDSASFAKLLTDKTTKRVLGLPKVYSTLQQARNNNLSSTMPYDVPLVRNIPSLRLMSEGAIHVLSKNKNGFFLMIEGGAIDWASHDNQSQRMLEEMKDFLETIATVVDWVNNNSNWDETLLIVTSDHECGFLWGTEGIDTYNPVINKGKGNMPLMKWYADDHTNALVPFFAKGAGSNIFQLFADEYDPRYGFYIQNAVVAQAIFMLWNTKFY